MEVIKNIIVTTLVIFATSKSLRANEISSISEITIVSSNSYPVAVSNFDKNKLSRFGIRLTAFNLDAVSGLENQINQNLPKVEAQASVYIRSYIEEIGQEQFNQRFVEAYQGHIYAIKHGIKHIPAFVFNNKSVVYDAKTLDEAIAKYQLSIKGKQGSLDVDE